MLVAVGVASVATFGNTLRAGLRAEEKAELLALGELRVWALANTNADLGGPAATEAVRAYLATVAGDVEIRDILAKHSFHDEKNAYAIVVVGMGSVGTAQARDPAFRSGFEEFLRSDPKVGEVAYEFLGPGHAQAERLFLRQLEAEGLSVKSFREPWNALDRELKRLAGEKAGASDLKTAQSRASKARDLLAAGDLAGARGLFLQALAAEPLLASANAGLAEVYSRKKMPQLAVRFAELGFCSEGNRRELYEAWSQAQQAAGREPEAKLAAGFAAQTAPGAPLLAALLPSYTEMLGAKAWRTALLLRCDALLPLNELRQRWTRREEAARKLLEQGKTAFARSKDTKEALGLFAQAIDADPFNAETLNYAAACFRAQQNFAGTRVLALLATKMDPNSAPARVNLAIAFEELGAPSLALQELQKARDLKPQDSWSQRKIAEGLNRLAGAASEGKKP